MLGSFLEFPKKKKKEPFGSMRRAIKSVSCADGTHTHASLGYWELGKETRSQSKKKGKKEEKKRSSTRLRLDSTRRSIKSVSRACIHEAWSGSRSGGGRPGDGDDNGG